MTGSSPRFSIIVPTFRRPQYLAEALAAIQSQTDPDFECLVVGDGDSSGQEHLPADQRIRFISLPTNRGASAARNFGVANSCGQTLVFCDDDDVMTSDRLEILRGRPPAPITLCWARFMGDFTSQAGPLHNGVPGMSLLAQTTPSLGVVAIDRAAWLELDETMRTCEDLDWWIRQRHLQVRTIARVGYLVRRHPGTRHRSGSEERIADSQLLLQRYAQLFDAAPLAKAYRLYRIGSLHIGLGETRAARRALLHSLRARPTPRAMKALMSTFRRTT